MHETEEVEEVINHIERLVNMLKRDEEPEIEWVNEDERIEEV